jgi:hypothetical protein
MSDLPSEHNEGKEHGGSDETSSEGEHCRRNRGNRIVYRRCPKFTKDFSDKNKPRTVPYIKLS